MEIERSDLNSLKVRDLSLVVYYENRRDESVRLFEVCEENLLRNDVVGGTTNFIKLKENNKHLIGLTENQKDIDKDLFILAERLLSNSENQEVLRNYRDWISYFNKLLKTKLDANTWFQAQGAVYRKVRKNLVNYAESERDCVSKLENTLENINMTLYKFEMLILLKLRSNIEFHGNSLESKTQARDKLNSLPNEMQIFKDPLQQLFGSLDILES
ncbi:hypothetical protein RclHR1_12760002 [Rhizophagus clarus]|uniref:Uncharacterized protein n=1 Tax=Rhizophagus clarus TaxID=94130 RepID=A0A2Z6QN23_9GLOM|nr:hypothetical protein RclHR1_12760002 [Rhizophagus clarus]GET04433.1 hypothetical protein GLOIN_2v1547411 [Rhizophagus clarus]